MQFPYSLLVAAAFMGWTDVGDYIFFLPGERCLDGAKFRPMWGVHVADPECDHIYGPLGIPDACSRVT
jgi:hypothetical protein